MAAESFMKQTADMHRSLMDAIGTTAASISSQSGADARAPTVPLTYKAACMELFNVAFKKYKQHKNQDEKVRKIGREQYPDYEIFCDIITYLQVLRELIKFSIWRHKSNWDTLLACYKISTTQELLDMKFNMPNTYEDIITLFKTHPWTVDDLQEDLFKIVNLDNYEFMLRLSKVNQFLYFNTFPEPEDADPILECEEDTTELVVIVKGLVKKLLKHHIEIAKIVEPKTADVNLQSTAVDADNCDVATELENCDVETTD